MVKKEIKLVCGVGVNNADYVVQKSETVRCENGKRRKKVLWVCPFYQKWLDMLKRCYSAYAKKNHPSYDQCRVCEEWLTFSNFKLWMEQQDWEGKELDKDILYHKNKIYGPDTCVFVDHHTNSFLLDKGGRRGFLKMGVSWQKSAGKFKAQCNDGSGKSRYLGLFDTEQQAHEAWLSFKLEQAKLLAEMQTDERVAKALVERYANYKPQEI